MRTSWLCLLVDEYSVRSATLPIPTCRGSPTYGRPRHSPSTYNPDAPALITLVTHLVTHLVATAPAPSATCACARVHVHACALLYAKAGLDHIHTSTLPSRRVPMPTQVSIRYAFRHSVRITAAVTTHVLKLTGRYYVPAMDAHLLAANLTQRTASIRQARAFAPSGYSPVDAFRLGMDLSRSRAWDFKPEVCPGSGRSPPPHPASLLGLASAPRLHTAQAPIPLAAMPCEAFGCRLRTYVAKHSPGSPKVAEAWSAQGWTVCDMMFRCPCAPLPPPPPVCAL